MQSQLHEPATWEIEDVLSDAAASLEGRKQSRAPGAASVLVVEDDLHLAEALKLRFEQVGLAVRTASTGTAARWDLLQSPFDVVVLDLGLPDKHGLDLMDELKHDVELPPFIVLTGAESEDCDQALMAGAKHVFRKPCPNWLLTEAVLGLVKK